MPGSYVKPVVQRHREEFIDGVEQLHLPLRRNWFALAFLCVWLTGWTLGGFAALGQLLHRFDSFLAIWLCGWALGWIFAVTSIVSQLGAERLRMVHGDLEISVGVGPIRRTWTYRGDAIADLRESDVSGGLFSAMGPFNRVPYSFFMRPRTGAVRFDYGADTMYLAQGVGAPEARVIAEWLRRRLPRAA